MLRARRKADALQGTLDLLVLKTLSLGPQHADRPAAGLLTLLLVIRDAQRDGTWRRLKACGNPDCQWAFYDRSHSGVGAWCDMATCGNRIKNRRLRQRSR